MKKTLDSLLHLAGANKCYVGYSFFAEAVSMALEDPSRLSGIRKNIYLPIARRHNVSMFQLEKNIRTVRDVILRNDGHEMLEELTGRRFRRKDPLYPKELIEIFADYLREPDPSSR